MDAFELRWPEGEAMQPGMLLLVAVEAPVDAAARGVPCRVVGSLTPGSPFHPPAPREPAGRVTQVLASLGVPTNLRGYGYLRSALMLALERPETLRGLGRRLYPAVAREHGASVPAVERAIRHAIAVTWLRGGGERCRRLVGRECSCVGDHPSNGELLTMLADAMAGGRL